jgi:hypothetical protein
MKYKKELSKQQTEDMLTVLQNRFQQNMNRHKNIQWINVYNRLKTDAGKIWSLNEMEITDGEPDVVDFDKNTGEYIFFDCSAESPKGRRSFCYDRKALDSRKEHKPQNSAIDMANAMGVEILSEEQYKALQQLGSFDAKTSSWIKTPQDIRMLGGAIFADFRYGNVFVYHNGAESYYAARGFRAFLKV